MRWTPEGYVSLVANPVTSHDRFTFQTIYHEKYVVNQNLHLKNGLWNDVSNGIRTPPKHGEDRNVATREKKIYARNMIFHNGQHKMFYPIVITVG